MTSLSNLQQSMQASILNDDQQSIEQAVVKPGDMTVSGRLRIYRNAYYLRLVDILVTDFEGLYQHMGKKAFNAMAYDYIDSFPSHSYTVHTIGQNLSVFLKEQHECDPIYYELACFEQAMNEALLKEDAPTIVLSELTDLSQEQWLGICFQLHPTLVVLHFNTNVI